MAISGVGAEASRLQVRGYAQQQQRMESRAENLALGDRIYEERQADSAERFGGAAINYAGRQRLLDIEV